MGRSTLICGISLVLVVMLSSPGLAAKTTLNSSALAVIAAPDTLESRLLMKFNLPMLPEGHEIYHAEITLKIPNLVELTEVELYEVGSAWSPGSAAWSGTWKEAGGDIRGKRLDSWMADDKTGDLVKFIVTESASNMIAGRDANYGFIVVCTNEGSQRLALPSEGPTLTIYRGPMVNDKRTSP